MSTYVLVKRLCWVQRCNELTQFLHFHPLLRLNQEESEWSFLSLLYGDK